MLTPVKIFFEKRAFFSSFFFLTRAHHRLYFSSFIHLEKKHDQFKVSNLQFIFLDLQFIHPRVAPAALKYCKGLSTMNKSGALF